ncbi:hypothetical protein LTR56_002194 [Elasticomyces elasticus]|nr:hypothetical protein LTR56_002194 [Elasticomyces elasticus]
MTCLLATPLLYTISDNLRSDAIQLLPDHLQNPKPRWLQGNASFSKSNKPSPTAWSSVVTLELSLVIEDRLMLLRALLIPSSISTPGILDRLLKLLALLDVRLSESSSGMSRFGKKLLVQREQKPVSVSTPRSVVSQHPLLEPADVARMQSSKVGL